MRALIEYKLNGRIKDVSSLSESSKGDLAELKALIIQDRAEIARQLEAAMDGDNIDEGWLVSAKTSSRKKRELLSFVDAEFVRIKEENHDANNKRFVNSLFAAMRAVLSQDQVDAISAAAKDIRVEWDTDNDADTTMLDEYIEMNLLDKVRADIVVVGKYNGKTGEGVA